MRTVFFSIAWLLSVSVADAQIVTSVITTADLSRRMAPGEVHRFGAAARSRRVGGVTIVVDDAVRFQRIDGFGASITDSAAYLLTQKLEPASRAGVLRTLFDPHAGMGLSFLRQPIGSEDLSRHHFSLDDVPPGNIDPGLARFRIPPEQAEELRLVRAARRINPTLTVMATPWSPPAWMKSGDTMNGGRLEQRYEPVYADYLVAAMRAFGDAGVPVRYLSVQNEPLNDLNMMASAAMPAEQAARFIGDRLGPALRRAGLATRILTLDHSWDQSSYAATVLSDRRAARYIAGTAFHCYGGKIAAQTALHDAFPTKGIWLTECSGGTWDKEPALIKTGRILIDATRNWAKAVTLWGVALDQARGPWDGGCDTCRPLVTIDVDRHPAAVTYNADLYGLGQAARFVAPGAVRIASTATGADTLDSVAFLNRDRRIALLVLNRGAVAARFTIAWRGQMVTERVPPTSLATFVWST